jgi:uncharacterized membrane protein YfcA
VYLVTSGEAMAGLVVPIAVTTAGVLLGTLVGTRLLRRIPERAFVRIVSAMLLILGATMLVRAL